MLETSLKSIALDAGAIRAGIARREAFLDSPPSADMTYLEPWAKAVVSFALPLGTDWIDDYLGKVTRMGFKKVLFDAFHKIYQIGSAIEARLKESGFRAHNMIPNGIYRPDHTFEKEISDKDVKPPVSLRYMAVGAGVGVFGWSGNVLVPGAWSNVYLGGVLTDAPLGQDSILAEKLCDDCRICARVCPTEFIDKTEKVSVAIGGCEHVYNSKRGDLRCVIGCGGYTGLSRDGTWSSWSTGRTRLPDDYSKLPSLHARLRDDPANKVAKLNQTFGSKGILDRSFEHTNPTCSNCMIVCSGPRERRKSLMELLHSSGVVERDRSGREIVVRRPIQ
jgi:ferredoxin